MNKETGGIKPQHEWVREINWDLVIFDEYHFGAWKENAKALFLMEDEEEEYNTAPPETNTGNVCDEQDLPITADHYLYLSGTPFRALNSGEFIEEQIYSWTYSDEQRAKAAWQGKITRMPPCRAWCCSLTACRRTSGKSLWGRVQRI